jgi:phosphinothricin acetyltransferase
MVNIRNAKLSDLKQITRIYNWAVANSSATFDINEQTIEERTVWFGHYGEMHPLIVAEMDGKVAGYACLSKFREKEGYRRSAEVSVYVDPDLHGRGIGKSLLSEILDRGRTLGYHVIIAGITADNEISIKLHEKFGFKASGHLKEVGFKFDRWQDVLFYQLIL